MDQIGSPTIAESRNARAGECKSGHSPASQQALGFLIVALHENSASARRFLDNRDVVIALADPETTTLIAIILMSLSAAILLTLGTLHLVYTFRGSKLTPRDPALRASMSQVSPVITRQTTMWRAWVGFNASHSMGAILFGLIYGFLANFHAELLFASPFLLLVGLAMLGGFFVLGKLYWFRIPFVGIGIALACYVASIAASWA